MKKSCLLFFAVALFYLSALAQIESSTQGNVKLLKPSCVVPILDGSPLYIVDGFETDKQSFVINPKNVEQADVLKDKKAIKKYGEKAKAGVIVIKTKPGTEFYTLADFVNAEKNINSSVIAIQLNDLLIPDIKKLWIDKKAFPSTMISSDITIDKKNCMVIFNDTLVITTKFLDYNE